MGEALRWLVTAHLAYAAGLLPWALLLAAVLRRGGYPRHARARTRAAAGTAAPQPHTKLPQPPLMDLNLEPIDPSPPAWASGWDAPGRLAQLDADPEAGFLPRAEDEQPPPDAPAVFPSEAAGDRRLALAEARDLARSALLRLSGSGYYAFEDLLVSGVGAIDQLVVGPAGLRVLLVAPERGHVWREEGGEITYSTDAAVDLEAGKIRGTFENPEEDLDAMSRALVEDVTSKLGGAETSVWPVIVFPHAEVLSGPGGARAIVDVWNLAEALDGPEDRHLSPAAAEDLVACLARAYGREPWMRPTPDYEPCADA